MAAVTQGNNALAGKSAIVTGGAGGFGLASALLLARDGAAVTLTGRNLDSLNAARQQIERGVPGARVSVCAGDSNRDADMRAVVATATKTYGRLDMVAATVGSTIPGMLTDLTGDQFMESVALSLRPAYVAIRESIPAMPDGGSFAFISSTAAVMPFIGLSGYCAGKAALDHLVRAAANEMGARGYRFNAVRPGVVRTGATGHIFSNEPVMNSFLERVPMGRLGEPDEVAQAIRYLLGPESRWTTGQCFAVDGGNELRGAPMPV
jgi:NAD(P)-dependent dehydrogenase (short-subunit alcohol dehydrogenase family)